ncbi:MAG TPA: hypothetical protein PK299_11460, partial [Anaerolineales bacterium]|nr:hypothetical protein [Anaerolineales bacterium]
KPVWQSSIRILRKTEPPLTIAPLAPRLITQSRSKPCEIFYKRIYYFNIRHAWKTALFHLN